MNEFFKKILRAVARYTFFFCRWFISLLPFWLFKAFRAFFMAVGRPFVLKKRKLAIDNLNFALGKEKTPEEILQIADACFYNIGKGMIDTIYFIDRHEELVKKIRIEGKEHLEAAIKQGNGVIFVSAHFGNFILMYLRILFEGYTTNVIMRRVRDEAFEKYISQFRDEQGLKTIYDLPSRQCVVNSIRALRKNEVLFILLDQNYGTDGRVFVDFFGQKAATATGPVVFSKRTQSPVMPVFIMREKADRHKIVIDAPVALDTFANVE